MIVREITPEQILVNVETLKSAISIHEDQRDTKSEFENSRDVFLAILGGFVSCLLTLFSSWKAATINIKILISVFSIIFLFLTFWFFIKMIQAWIKLKRIGRQDLETYLLDEAKKDIRYTALLIICYQKSKTGEVSFMTEKNGNYLVHCDMDPFKGVDEQRESIINYLANTYNIHKNHIVDVIPLSGNPFFSIKPIHEKPTQNAFVFFQIKLKKKAKQSLSTHKDVSWKSIQEMEDMPELMGRNQDIVMALNENKTKIFDSFDDYRGPLHIIWNITNKCPYSCAICATHDDARKELKTEDKLKVLNNIFSAKESISTLDFAGGDPMCDSGTRTVIIQAINSLGEDHISITTTGMGIQSIDDLTEEELSKLLSKCEITIDASHENLSPPPEQQSTRFSRNSPQYCKNNFEQIQSTSETLRHLIINIPLLDDSLDEIEIQNLISKLSKLKQQYPELQIDAQLIRLMPVGAFKDKWDKDSYKKYSPIKLAKKLKAKIEGIGISCRYHCSLRVLPEIEESDPYCSMLEQKIGIDCSGNVFACTWGAYLPLRDNDIEKNPFYLGNVVSTSLKEIIGGHGIRTDAYKRIFRDIQNKTRKPYCEAVSWYFNHSTSENNDPLSTG